MAHIFFFTTPRIYFLTYCKNRILLSSALFYIQRPPPLSSQILLFGPLHSFVFRHPSPVSFLPLFYFKISLTSVLPSLYFSYLYPYPFPSLYPLYHNFFSRSFPSLHLKTIPIVFFFSPFLTFISFPPFTRILFLLSV